MDNDGPGTHRFWFGIFSQIEINVIADGFRKAGRSNTDRFGVVLTGQVVQGRLQVVATAKDRTLLAEVGRRDVYGFLEVADDVATNIGGTALWAVDQGNAVLNPSEDQAGTQWCAEFAGVSQGSEVPWAYIVKLLQCFLCFHIPPPW